MAEQRDQVFVSYSHADPDYLKRLMVHLRPYEKQSQIDVWSDTKIKPGQPWRNEIEIALKRAAVAVLLISADFLASDFIVDEELPKLLQAAQSEGVKILSIILKPCAFTTVTSISQFQTVNDPARPLISMDEAEKELTWVNLAKSVQEAMDDFKAQAMAKEQLDKALSLPKTTIRWDKVATLFWLGNDLMWIQDMAYRVAPPERILQGINHAIKYIEELGFSPDSSPCQDLNIAKLIVEALVGLVPSTDEKIAVLEGHYRGVLQYVQTAKWYINALAEIQQPDFKKLRAI